ncbi:MAG TPA: substrate-binding domain-containing protein [Casimicrobiaceae bacterium]|nr:substrate-binding domain-containing protein [Casimicrobiaceae bacterium]
MVLEATEGEPVAGISSMATRHVLAELTEAYTRRSGQRIAIVSAGGLDAARRVRAGEAFDFVVLAAEAIEALASDGRVDPGSRTDLARSAVAIAIAAGAARPDVSTESAVRDAVLRARTIGYSTGPSGAHLVRLFEGWGIAETIAPRVVQAPPGLPVGTLLARGDVELGFQQLSELMHLPGIEVVGLLPAGIQAITVFSAALCTAARHAAAARKLLSFLASPEADAAKRSHGMEPA